MNTSETAAERFWSRCDDSANPAHDREGKCILWRGSLHPEGWGVLSFHRRRYLAHRWLYEQTHGPLPKGRLLKQRCLGPRSCVLHWAPVPPKPKTTNKHPWSTERKLTPSDVLVARALWTAGGTHVSTLARQFNVSLSVMSKVLHGHSYKHVDPDAVHVLIPNGEVQVARRIGRVRLPARALGREVHIE